MSTTTQTQPGELTERELAELGEPDSPNYRKGSETIRLAHSMATQGAMARQAAHNEDLRQAVNRESIPELDRGEPVDQQLNIDSPTVIHNHYEATKPEPTPEPKKMKTEKRKKGLGTLAKLAIGAGLIGTGAGIPAGVGFVIDALKEKPAPPVVKPAEPNDATRYSLDLGE